MLNQQKIHVVNKSQFKLSLTIKINQINSIFVMSDSNIK